MRYFCLLPLPQPWILVGIGPLGVVYYFLQKVNFCRNGQGWLLSDGLLVVQPGCVL